VSLALPDRTTSASRPPTLTSTTISRNKKHLCFSLYFKYLWA
jgi:hypothetical protein